MNRKPETVAFWRRRLPHWEVVDGRYFVTMHLRGTIPRAGQERIREMAAELSNNFQSDNQGDLKLQPLIFSEMEAWLDRAEQCTYLQNTAVAEMVMEAIQFRARRIWNMFEYVVMPNHLHLFFELLEPGLKNHLEQFKRWTGHEAARLLQSRGDAFWQDEWFDHWSRSDEQDEQIIEYLRANPVKARLVSNYVDWPFGGWRQNKPGWH